MVSSRYALPVVIVLALAVVPTIIHSYLSSRHDDGLSVQSLPRVLDEYSSENANRHSKWGEEVFDSRDWIERIYNRQGVPAIRLFAARSYDHKRLYHHPELALSYGVSLQSQGVIYLSGSDPLPVHLLKGERGWDFVLYTLLYDNKLVEDPISHQIKDSLNLLIGAKKPMTLFYVASSGALNVGDINGSPAAQVLRTAVESFRSQSPSQAVQ